MKIVPPILLFLLFFGAIGQNAAHTQDRDSAEPRTVTFTGYIVDVMCGNTIAKKSNPMAKAPRHTRACALAEACAAEGYGMFAEGDWILFDEKGNTLANAALKKDTRKKALYFRVKGSYDGKRFAVTAIEPVPAPEAPQTDGTGSVH